MPTTTLDGVDAAIIRGDGIGIFDRILDSGVHLVLWERARPAPLVWVDGLDRGVIDDIDATVEGPDFAAGAGRLLRQAGYPADTDGLALAGEIARLAGRFARLMRSARLRLRLEVIETDACRKFHQDNVTVRLLMPLSGPGTQWTVASRADEATINQLSPGEVGLFKGRLGAPVPLILHRSPPIAGSGQGRLLLAIDPRGSGEDGGGE